MSHIFSNIDTLIIILQYFQIKEQLNLCGVCDEFKAVIVQYIWRQRYRRLRVYQLKDDLFVLNRTYKRGVAGKALLKYESFEPIRKIDVENFLYLHKENLYELELCDYRGRIYAGLPRPCISTDWNFPNLRTLKLNSCQVHLEHLFLIRSNCLNLKVFHMNQCLNDKLDIFILKDEFDPVYNELLNVVKMLTEFHMKFQSTKSSPYPLILYDFLYEYNLKVLHFELPINNIESYAIPKMENNTCEDLQIASINDYRVFQRFYSNYLYAFRNLQILSLHGSLSKLLISTHFIEHLAACAPKLRNLKLKRCDIDVDDFGTLGSLTEITFDNCMSITWKNMNQLLQSPHIYSYCSNLSSYIGEFHNITLSESLEKLTLVGFEERFQDIFAYKKEPSKNLKYLQYYDATNKMFFNMSKRFPNLEFLYILPYHLDKDDFYRLASLEVYGNSHFHYEIYLKELLFILKHPSLRELSLSYAQELAKVKFTPTPIQLKTNLKYIRIEYLVFDLWREIWYLMLATNPQLTVIVRASDIDDLEYYYTVLRHDNFSRNCLRLSGFRFDVDHIYDTPEIAEQEVEIASQISLYRDLYLIM